MCGDSCRHDRVVPLPLGIARRGRLHPIRSRCSQPDVFARLLKLRARLADRRLGLDEIFGDEVVAAAMFDRLVHHAEILSLKDDSYRLRDGDLAAAHPPASPETA
jgi:hypothetical protein